MIGQAQTPGGTLTIVVEGAADPDRNVYALDPSANVYRCGTNTVPADNVTIVAATVNELPPLGDS